jgi:predicted acyl esterase
MVGPVMVHLRAKSSAPEAGFAAELVDVAPLGLARDLTDRIAGCRDAPDQPPQPKPGKVVEDVISPARGPAPSRPATGLMWKSGRVT